MTGQMQQNIARIRELAAQGAQLPDVAAALDLCQPYVLTLAKTNHINILLPPSRFAIRRAQVRAFAGQGKNSAEIAEAVGLDRARVYQLCRELGVKLPRKRHKNAKLRPSLRERQMEALYRSGRTLNEIGKQYGITRERVRQLLKKFFGVTATDGGQHVVAVEKQRKFESARNARALKRWGCSWDDYAKLRALKKPLYAFNNQKRTAGARGIGWELTLWQWWSIWQQSGHLHERGRGQGYVMCRKGDIGSYAVDNVFIATSRENCSNRPGKKSGLPMGVSQKRGRFTAVRHINGQKLYLGTFPTPELAHAAYLAADLDIRSAA